MQKQAWKGVVCISGVMHTLIIEGRQCDWGTLSKSFEKYYTFEDALFESEILNPSLKDDEDSIKDYLPSPIQLYWWGDMW